MAQSKPISVAISWENDVSAACLQSLWSSRTPEIPMDIHILLREGDSCDDSLFRNYRGIHIHSYPAGKTFTPLSLTKLLPDLSKVLYLASDTLVRKPLESLFDTELDQHDAAAVKNCAAFTGEPVSSFCPPYDDGVLLLNLDRLRGQNSRRLQKIKTLPVRWNLPASGLYLQRKKWRLEKLNQYQGCRYKLDKDLYTDAAVYRFSGKEKPWEKETLPFASDWRVAYQDAPLRKHERFDPPRPHQEEYLISVVIPTYNVEDYIAETLDCIFSQSCQDFEVICADDGSTDRTVEIIGRYAAVHDNLTLLTGPNVSAGYERNRGVDAAKGKYIYFMDSDDKLDPNAFAIASRYAEVMNLDVVYFEGNTFYENDNLKQRFGKMQNAYIRDHVYPGLYPGWNYYAQSKANVDFSPTPYMKLTRLSLLRENGIRFLETRQTNDIYQSYCTVMSAKRVTFLPLQLYHRRIRENSIVTDAVYQNLDRMIESRCANWVGICLLAGRWKHKRDAYFWLMYSAERMMNDLLDSLDHAREKPDYSAMSKYWKTEEVMEASALWQEYMQKMVGAKEVLTTKQMRRRINILRKFEKTRANTLIKKMRNLNKLKIVKKIRYWKKKYIDKSV